MSDREPVRLTSLDETFDDAMKDLLGGVDVRSATVATPAAAAAAPPTRVSEALGYLRATYGLEPLASGAPTAAERTGGLGGWLRRIARRLFVSRTYHSTLVTMVADVAERQAALDARLQALASAQSLANERAARVVFRLWGDYNHLVRVVLDHHVNEVFGAFERHFGAFERHFGAFQDHFHAFEKQFDASSAAVREVTEALRKLEQAVHQMEGPHDDLVRSVSELLAARAREEVLARRVEAIEGERGATGEPTAS